MPFVYRYINVDIGEIVYIGKVKGYESSCLTQRHKQHRREDWYKENEKSLIMQYCEVPTAADADIYETLGIAYYAETGQLVNKDKTSWGQPKDFPMRCFLMDLRWKTYGSTAATCGSDNFLDEITKAVNDWWSYMIRYDEVYPRDSQIDYMLSDLNSRLKTILYDVAKGKAFARFGQYEDFKRITTEEDNYDNSNMDYSSMHGDKNRTELDPDQVAHEGTQEG